MNELGFDHVLYTGIRKALLNTDKPLDVLLYLEGWLRTPATPNDARQELLHHELQEFIRKHP